VVSTTDAFSRTVIERLNTVRRRIGFGPVRLSAVVSSTATRLAPQYFAADQTPGGGLARMDNIALGLLAGCDRLAVARKRVGLKPPLRLARMARFLREELQRVHDGRTAPEVALEAALHHGSSRFRAGMRGYVIEATPLEALQIPDEVIRRSNLYMEIGVTHHRPPGAAWGQLVIVLVFVDESPVKDQVI
jgi:hypothetical protein